MDDKITLTREQWELIRKYIIFTEPLRKKEISIWESLNTDVPSKTAKNILIEWQEMDIEIERLLNIIE